MYLTRHEAAHGPRMALNGAYLPEHINLKMLLKLSRADMVQALQTSPVAETADHPLLPPLDPSHEVWAAGVTYLRSRKAREAESDVRDVYERVYTAERPELILRQKVGRLLNDKMPTGVAVVPAMNHGGSFPATGHPGFTAVGIPASLVRFSALHCYDNVRQQRLPLALRDKNPNGRMWRLIDDQWSQQDV